MAKPTPTVTIDQALAISRSAYMHGYVAAIRGDSPNRMEDDAPRVVSYRVSADMVAPKAPEVPAPAQPEVIPPALPWLVAALREAVKTGNTGMLHERLNDMDRVIAAKVYPDGWAMAQEAILDLQELVDGRFALGCTAHDKATRALANLRMALGIPAPKSEISDVKPASKTVPLAYRAEERIPRAPIGPWRRTRDAAERDERRNWRCGRLFGLDWEIATRPLHEVSVKEEADSERYEGGLYSPEEVS